MSAVTECGCGRRNFGYFRAKRIIKKYEGVGRNLDFILTIGRVFGKGVSFVARGRKCACEGQLLIGV